MIPRVAPPDVLNVLDQALSVLTVKLADESSFMNNIEQNVQNLTTGGVWIDTSSRQALFAYEATDTLNGPTMLNLVSNVLYSAVGRADSEIIFANYMAFPLRDAQGLSALKWVSLVYSNVSVIANCPPSRYLSVVLLWWASHL